MPDTRFGPGGSDSLAKPPGPETAGQRLRRARERLGLRVRDVELASQKISEKHHNEEYTVLINRISEIENRGLIPSIYKLYSLYTIYRLNFMDVMEWYGVSRSTSVVDSLLVDVARTHEIGFRADDESEAPIPISLDPGIDSRKTTYLSRMIQKWGRLPLLFLDSLDLKEQRYAFIGTDDWFMHPLIQPGAFLIIDDTRRRVATSGWTSEFDRPIYFLEHRQGFACAWCSVSENRMILQPHPSSGCEPQVFAFPTDIEVVGQVLAIAMRLDPSRKRYLRSASIG
jgi:transcriptional regulator with XRE-family HTH domain